MQVDLSCNLLSELPETFGNLKKLKVNPSSAISLGILSSSVWADLDLEQASKALEQIALLYNSIVILLKPMQALYLSNNGLKTLPRTLFSMCLQLSILDLHGTEITIDLLRQVHTFLSDNLSSRHLAVGFTSTCISYSLGSRT